MPRPRRPARNPWKPSLGAMRFSSCAHWPAPWEEKPASLAAGLLSAAIADAKSYLSEPGVDALERAKRELLVEELPEHQPGVEFHGGGT